MCLSIPGKVERIEKSGKIIVDYSGEKREAEMAIVEVKEGDYVIVNNKIVIERISKEKAEKFLEVVNN